MMPLIRLDDATFSDLKSIATWRGTDTPSQTVVEIVRREMEKLGLARESDAEAASDRSDDDVLEFKKAPGLSFTKPVFASVNGDEIKNPKWATLLVTTITEVKSKGLVDLKLVRELQIPSRVGEYSEEGFKYHADLGISVQGQSAQDAWKEVERLSQKWRMPVIVKFQWRQNEKAQHPGRLGILRSGGA